MKTKKLGRTGLDVSPICPGCLTYGIPERGPHQWTLREEESRPLIKRALDLSAEEIAALEAPHTRHAIVGFE
jgi:aryl-alcohol dehydrogenase-like predicted oxidoreductase